MEASAIVAWLGVAKEAGIVKQLWGYKIWVNFVCDPVHNKEDDLDGNM